LHPVLPGGIGSVYAFAPGEARETRAAGPCSRRRFEVSCVAQKQTTQGGTIMTRAHCGVLTLVFLSGGSLAFAQTQKPAEKTTAPAGAKPATAAPGAPSAAKPAGAAPTAAAPTAAATPPGLPTPSPELDTLYKGLEGSWKCDTTMAPGAIGPG